MSECNFCMENKPLNVKLEELLMKINFKDIPSVVFVKASPLEIESVNLSHEAKDIIMKVVKEKMISLVPKEISKIEYDPETCSSNFDDQYSRGYDCGEVYGYNQCREEMLEEIENL